jgi:opacity protein-like surface antigen
MNRIIATGLAFIAAVSPIESARAVEPSTFEATLFGGYRYGGKFDGIDPATDSYRLDSGAVFGIALNWQQSSDAYYEVSYNRQSGGVKDTSQFDMSIEYLHIGGYVQFGDPEARVIPYFLMTVGATRFNPNRSEFDDEIEPSLAIGGGVKIRFSKNVGLRLEARGYGTFIDSDSDLFCLSSPPSLVCEISVQCDTLIQGQALVGVSVGF